MPRLSKAARLLQQANDGKKREDLAYAKRRILRQLAKEGTITEAEAQEQYVALEVIPRLIKDPLTRPALKFLCAKELWPHEAMTLAEQARLDAADAAGGPPTICITVQPFAFAGPKPTALPGPDETIVIEANMPRTDIPPSAFGLPWTNGSTPAPSLSDRERLRQQVLASRETVVVEVPPQPDGQPHVVGRMSQGKPYELTTDEQIRIMETLKRGLPQ
jgi:hypothetical protein